MPGFHTKLGVFVVVAIPSPIIIKWAKRKIGVKKHFHSIKMLIGSVTNDQICQPIPNRLFGIQIELFSLAKPSTFSKNNKSTSFSVVFVFIKENINERRDEQQQKIYFWFFSQIQFKSKAKQWQRVLKKGTLPLYITISQMLFRFLFFSSFCYYCCHLS